MGEGISQASNERHRLKAGVSGRMDASNLVGVIQAGRGTGRASSGQAGSRSTGVRQDQICTANRGVRTHIEDGLEIAGNPPANHHQISVKILNNYSD